MEAAFLNSNAYIGNVPFTENVPKLKMNGKETASFQLHTQAERPSGCSSSAVAANYNSSMGW